MADTAPINTLSGPTISHYMVASLPKAASPHIRNAFDAIALAIHASMLAVGFRLVGLGEDHKIEAQSEAEAPSPLPSEWNEQNGIYAFRYKHTQSSMEYLLKISKLGKTAAIMGVALGDDRVASFEVKTDEYVSSSDIPYALDETEDTSLQERKIATVFITIGRLSDLGSLVRVKLLQRLVPSLHKEGYEESSGPRERDPAPGREDSRPRHDPLREDRDSPARPYPLHDPLAAPSRGPRGPLPEPIPGFDDEHGLQRPARGMPPGGFGNIGDRDLYPQGLGPRDPIRGGIGPGYGPLGGGAGGGGMHPTFDDPLFAGQGQRGGGYDPMAPPGARFDPTGPGMAGHPRGAGMGGRPPNPFGGFGSDDFI